MSRLLALLVAGIFLWTASGCCESCAQEKVSGRDYVTIANEAVWTWSDDVATLAHCVATHLANYEVKTVPDDGQAFHHDLEIRLFQGDKLILTINGHSETVFTRLGQVLFVSNHGPIRTGCEVYALDLKTGKELWRSHLEGIGPIMHSKYRNHVAIENDGHAIIVRGKESSGSYIEYLDKDTGKTLANKAFK